MLGESSLRKVVDQVIAQFQKHDFRDPVCAFQLGVQLGSVHSHRSHVLSHTKVAINSKPTKYVQIEVTKLNESGFYICTV